MVAIERSNQLTLDEREVRWQALADQRQLLLATEPGTGTTLLVPMGWQTYDTGLVVTTLWDQQVDFTYSQSQRVWDFDTPPSYEGPLGMPVINFNRSDEWLQAEDAAFWNDSAGTTEPSYCWAMWVFLVAGAAAQVLWSKSTTTNQTGQDWTVHLSSTEQFTIRIIDDAVGAYIGSITSTVLSAGWHHLAGTKNDAGIDSASVITYVDGEEDRSDSTNGVYSDQQDGTNNVRIGAELDGGAPNGSPIAGAACGPVFRQVDTGAVWTPDVIRRDYELTRPYLTGT